MKPIKPFLLAILFPIIIFGQKVLEATPQWRPQYHFTPLKNWTNDPNGLIYLNGTYHLYNQQNPFENNWGHMSWGHATSRDLIHWEHWPVAMPETIGKDTTWRFSGCAVWDKSNTSGLCKTRDCIIAIYTADQPNLKKESQFIAYSNDGGNHFINYSGNPVIDLQKKDFRDPNVFWFEKTKQWTMVVALPQERKVRFYGSKNLKNWNLLSEFGEQGYTKAAWECPFLIQLPVDKNNKEQRWVLFTSAGGPERGPFMQYFVGDFDGYKFTNENSVETILPVDEGDCFYAAIPWNNLSQSKKLYIGWMVPGPEETYPWKGQMSVPRDLGLTKTKLGIRLFQRPSIEVRNNIAKYSNKNIVTIKNLKIKSGEQAIDAIRTNVYWLDAELEVNPGGVAGFIVGEKKSADNKFISGTKIAYDVSRNQLYVDRSRMGGVKLKKEKILQRINLPGKPGKIKLEILVDNSSLEIFVNGGRSVLTSYIFPEKNAHTLSMFVLKGGAVVRSLKIHDLSNIEQGL